MNKGAGYVLMMMLCVGEMSSAWGSNSQILNLSKVSSVKVKPNALWDTDFWTRDYGWYATIKADVIRRRKDIENVISGDPPPASIKDGWPAMPGHPAIPADYRISYPPAYILAKEPRPQAHHSLSHWQSRFFIK